jgi:sugar phosphate isomerase/epimerase
LIERAANLGFELVQIADNLPIHQMSEAGVEEIREASLRLGIAIELGTRGIDPGHLLKYLKLCETLSCSLLRVVVDTADSKPSEDEIVSTLDALLPSFESAGITLAIENHDRFKSGTMARIVRRLGSACLGICLDTVNSFGALEGPEAVVERLGPLVVNLHAKDFLIRRAPHQMGFTIMGTPAGRGLLDFPWLLDQLEAAGSKPNLILELWPSPEADTALTIAKEEQWCETSAVYLRSLIRGRAARSLEQGTM